MATALFRALPLFALPVLGCTELPRISDEPSTDAGAHIDAAPVVLDAGGDLDAGTDGGAATNDAATGTCASVPGTGLELLAAAANAEPGTVICLRAYPYPLTSELAVNREVTIRGAAPQTGQVGSQLVFSSGRGLVVDRGATLSDLTVVATTDQLNALSRGVDLRENASAVTLSRIAIRASAVGLHVPKGATASATGLRMFNTVSTGVEVDILGRLSMLGGDLSTSGAAVVVGGGPPEGMTSVENIAGTSFENLNLGTASASRVQFTNQARGYIELKNCTFPPNSQSSDGNGKYAAGTSTDTLPGAGPCFAGHWQNRTGAKFL